jgi:ArsR family transcriptional regulator, arsenate/arsenite/antimonite-responsive transcriptional repressor / arsenate reductase (thioredoxin)
VEPPAFLHAAAHPLRWRLLTELARSDRQVHELTALLDQPQNLVSYHLAKLRTASLVTARRSSADARDSYYRLDLERCGELLASAGGALHPALRLTRPAPPVTARTSILFLCTGNSSRSQMAEAMLRHISGASAFSAGSNPKPISPYAVRVLAGRGIDISEARSKHLNEFTGRRFDYVITLCDRVREVCPSFPGQPRTVHWSIPDPARDPSGLPAFVSVAAEIEERIGFLLHTIAQEES